jgi:excisionase family DNA binding protein
MTRFSVSIARPCAVAEEADVGRDLDTSPQQAAGRAFLERGLSMDDVKRSTGNQTGTSRGSGEDHSSPWLTVTEAADRARCGVKLIYREVKARRLRAARVGGRRELRLRAEWIDTWLDAHTTPQEVVR